MYRDTKYLASQGVISERAWKRVSQVPYTCSYSKEMIMEDQGTGKWCTNWNDVTSTFANLLFSRKGRIWG